MVNTKVRLIIVFAAKDGKALTVSKNLEVTVAQIMNSLLQNSDLNWKVRKTTRPFRYDLNQIPYDYTLKESEVAQSCPALCDPMDCSLSGSSVHGIFQARVLA